ncbi:MAG: molybdenum cofactor biosynthesis protein MoaE [Sphingomonadaceae bacterium]|nr:molybdenum cofactor biosynthesis protein MoaE [Sphingomonadaceae bacterium]
MIPDVRLGTTDIDVAVELAALEGLGGGAVASFTGIVRGDDALIALELEHYPEMTLAAMTGIAEQAAARWPLLGLTVVHRHGRLAPGERIVFIGVAASRRGAAIKAMQFLIDWLKTRAPFWKREHRAGGGASWVEPREADSQAAARWESRA